MKPTTYFPTEPGRRVVARDGQSPVHNENCEEEPTTKKTMSTRNYLVWFGSVGAIIDVNPQELTSGDWGQIFDSFEDASHPTGKKPGGWPSSVHLDDRDSSSGVFWDSELSGPDGASYRLHVLPTATADDIKACKRYIYRSFDCTHLYLNRVKTLIDFKIPELLHEKIQL